jgi:two-component system NtrC family response regulator
MDRHRILVIEGDPALGGSLRAALCDGGYDAVAAASLDAGLGLVPTFAPAAVVADTSLFPASGGPIATRLRELGSDAALVVTAPLDRIAGAVGQLRAGADSYLVRPLQPGPVAVALEKALETRRLRREAAALRVRLRRRLAVVGDAPELRNALEVIRRVAPTKAAVLLHGEGGTGKFHLAQALHEASPRRDRPFVRASCAALSESLLDSALFGHEPGAFGETDVPSRGKLEAANGGTLYLHEVSRLPPALQIKLLRVLQQGEFERMGGHATHRVDVRVVAGTQRDLAEEVRAGRFRDDLYYRLNVVAVPLPPLRERKADIPALVNHFLEEEERERPSGERPTGVTPGALSALFTYGWPGNVRELQAAVERAARLARAREILPEDLSPVLHGARPELGAASALIPGASLAEIEREAILRTLDEVGGSTSRAAELLGVSIRKIQYRLKEYRGLDRETAVEAGRAPAAGAEP